MNPTAPPLASQASVGSSFYWAGVDEFDFSADTTLSDVEEETQAAAAGASPVRASVSSGSSTTLQGSDSSSPASVKRRREETPLDDSPRKRPRAGDSPVKAPKARGFWASPADNIRIGAELPPEQLRQVRELGIGVQFALARLLLAPNPGEHSLATILKHLPRLRGTHQAVGPHVAEIMRGLLPNPERLRGKEKELSAKAPHRELDREAEALRRDKYGCMGGITSSSSGLGWYGGQVQFAGKLSWDTEHGGLLFELAEPELAASSRFTRRWGSDFIVRVRVHRSAYASGRLEVARDFLAQPLVVFGRVYRFFYANKEHTAFFCATDETVPPTLDRRDKDRFLSLYDFTMWHNPIFHNTTQTLAKYNARVALGASNSVPGIQLLPHQIEYIDEVISPAHQGPGKPPAEMEMTDGCGFINLAGLKLLYGLGYWERVPTAIQMRLLGAKGLLVLDPHDRSEEPRVKLRPSQIKIKFPDLASITDPALLTIDVLRASHLKVGIRLSREMLTNLAENGVPSSVIEGIMIKQLTDAVDDLLEWQDVPWDGTPNEAMDKAMGRLWASVERSGGVMATRAARQNPGTARVRGLRSYDREEEESDDEEEDGADVEARQNKSTAWFPDETSGCPSTLEETVMTFIDGGFNPRNNGIMAAKHWEVVKKTIHSYGNKYRLQVMMSCSAFCIPDPYGVLEENEIQVKCSHSSLLQPDGRKSDKFIGDVLITRSPCKLPTDVRKVKAVCRPELDEYTDVIVFSIKGKRSMASFLGGGDYDGDKVDCIWHPDIVKHFKNAEEKYASAPVGFEKANFHKENETVAEFLKRVGDKPEDIVRGLQNSQMKTLQEALIGIYSCAHDNAVFKLGYFHPETIRLARMFCIVLDGIKSGLAVLEWRLKKDKQKYWVDRTPAWKTRLDANFRFGTSSENKAQPLERDLEEEFILTHLDKLILKQEDKQLERAQKCFQGLVERAKIDKDLCKPYTDCRTRANRLCEKGNRTMLDELSRIQKHVRDVYDASIQDRPQKKDKGKDSRKFGFTDLSIERRQDFLRSVSLKFDSFPNRKDPELLYFSYEDAVRVRASYAYYYLYEGLGRFVRFPFDVAMRELCLIKGKARPDGGWHAVVNPIHDVMRVRK